MKQWYFPTAFSCWGDEEAAAIQRVLASEQFTQGPEVETFEEEFRIYHGRKHAIMVNSGSSANLVAISALMHLNYIKRGDRALVPALAWATTYAPLIQHGIDLVLVDCDETWNADPFRMVKDTGEIKLVVGASILGNPADLRHWSTIAGVLGATFIEDNCESLGAITPEGRLCGTFGMMSTFSLFYSHQISAIEGGVILTDDPECARVCRLLRNHGWHKDPEAPFHREYDFHAYGYNVRGLEMHAAIARAQLRKLPMTLIRQRQSNADFFATLVMNEGLPITLPTYSGVTSPFGLHFTVPPGTRTGLAQALRAAGIDCRLPTGGSFTKHAYGAPWREQPTPKADAIHENGMFIGNGPLDLREHIRKAVTVIREQTASQSSGSER